MITTAADFPHGLRCIDCMHEIPPGDEYRDRLRGFTTVGAGPAGFDVTGLVPPELANEAAAVVELICVECDDMEAPA